jgi:hypothetical protein
MRAIEFITEARRNPEQNPKVSPYERVVARAQRDPNNTFVSLTAIDKLGINPGSKYNTPIGIYSYPAEYVVKTAPTTMKDLPFAGKSPFVNIFSARGNIVNVSNMTSAEYQAWANKASDVFANLYKKKAGEGTPEEKWKIGADIADKIVQNAPMEAKFGIPGGKFWYVTMILARWIVHQKLLNTNSVPVAWNSFFRMLGIDGCVDDGDGVIHTAERNQAVFFHSGAITDVERVDNKWDVMSQETGKDNMLEGIAKSAIIKWVRANPQSAHGFIYEYLTRYQNSEKPVMNAIAKYIKSLVAHIDTGPGPGPHVEEVILPDALFEIGNQGIWKAVSTIKLSNEEKLKMIQTWQAYESGPEVDIFVNEFKTPEFISFLEEHIKANYKDQKSTTKLLRLMATDRVLSPTLFIDLLDLGMSSLTMEGLAAYVAWPMEATQERIIPAAINNEHWAWAAIRNSAILTTDDQATLLAHSIDNNSILSALSRRYDPALNAVTKLVTFITISEPPNYHLANLSFKKLSQPLREKAIELIEKTVKLNPRFKPILQLALEV